MRYACTLVVTSLLSATPSLSLSVSSASPQQSRTAQARPSQARPSQPRPAQPRPSQARPSKADAAQSGAPDALARLEQAVSAQPANIASRRRLADAYVAAGRPVDAVAHLRKVTELAPRQPAAWYALGRAYNAIKQEALRSFDQTPGDAAWRQLLIADALAAKGHWTDAFALYRSALDRLPSMVTIHDAIARIYERTDHADWAARERASAKLSAADCASRRPLCEFRARRYQTALRATLRQADPESRYWRARAANELALAAFDRLDTLPDSLERRGVRATRARAELRYPDAVTEFNAALAFAPGDPSLTFELASSYYQMRDYEQTIDTLSPLLKARPDDGRLVQLMGYALLQARRIEEALPMLQRAVTQAPDDPGPRVALGRAYLQHGDFAEAVPLLEAQLANDRDGSLHVQLARAYNGLGQREKAEALLTRSQELQRASEERSAAATQRTIAPPDGPPPRQL